MSKKTEKTLKTRRSGVLLPVSSIPSPYGIGTFGKEAFNFIDFLSKAGQSYWQILPLGPTSYGDSPYQSFSTFAGNPYFIDLDILVKEKLLDLKDVKNIKVKNESRIDYGYLYKNRFKLLYKAYQRGIKRFNKSFLNFVNDNNYWINDYALFMALKKHFKNKSWLDWPDIDIQKRNNDSIIYYKNLLEDDIKFYCFI